MSSEIPLADHSTGTREVGMPTFDYAQSSHLIFTASWGLHCSRGKNVKNQLITRLDRSSSTHQVYVATRPERFVCLWGSLRRTGNRFILDDRTVIDGRSYSSHPWNQGPDLDESGPRETE